MGPKVYRNPYHVQIVRSQLNQNLYALYPEVRDEIVTALDDVLDLRGNGEYLFFSPMICSSTSEIPRMEECASAL